MSAIGVIFNHPKTTEELVDAIIANEIKRLYDVTNHGTTALSAEDASKLFTLVTTLKVLDEYESETVD